MPTPAYIDTTLYLPLGGVDGFELNGFAVNGVGFVDSPFAGVAFELDPYRSILQGEPQSADLRAIYPSVLPDSNAISYQGNDQVVSEVWAPRCIVEAPSERVESSLEAEVVSLAYEVEGVSIVPAEYRTAYVLATHPASTPPERKDSDVDELPPSEEPDEVDVSVVPPEPRTAKVPRGDS
jgi:hypothetical protein